MREESDQENGSIPPPVRREDILGLEFLGVCVKVKGSTSNTFLCGPFVRVGCGPGRSLQAKKRCILLLRPCLRYRDLCVALETSKLACCAHLQSWNLFFFRFLSVLIYFFYFWVLHADQEKPPRLACFVRAHYVRTPLLGAYDIQSRKVHFGNPL